MEITVHTVTHVSFDDGLMFVRIDDLHVSVPELIKQP